MTNINNLQFKSNKAVILLYPNSWYHGIREQEICKLCLDNELEIVSIIRPQAPYSPDAFIELINITNNYDLPVNLIIEQNSYFTYSQVINCSVLATLAMTGKINIYSYRKNSKNLVLEFIEGKESILLSIGKMHFEQLLAIADRKLIAKYNRDK